MSNLTRVLQNATCIVISIPNPYRKGKKKKNKETKWPIGPWPKNKINSNNSHGGFKCVCVYAELHHITQTLGHDLDTGKIR